MVRLAAAGSSAHQPRSGRFNPPVYRWVDHTSEVEIEIEAASEQEVLADALSALAELLDVPRGRRARAQGGERRMVHAEGVDRPALLAAWLEELVFLAESEGFVATGIERLELGPDALDATVSGSLAYPPPLVKAVTYHRLTFEPADGGYVARVVLDV